jgi:hypothetical protein
MCRGRGGRGRLLVLWLLGRVLWIISICIINDFAVLKASPLGSPKDCL